MRRRISGMLGVMAALAAVAVGCKKDPTAETAGTPAAVQAEFASLNVKVSGTATFTAWVVDARSTRLKADVSFATCDATKATISADASYVPQPPTSARAIVSGVAAGTTCVVVSSGSLTPDTVAVKVS